MFNIVAASTITMTCNTIVTVRRTYVLSHSNEINLFLVKLRVASVTTRRGKNDRVCSLILVAA